MNSTEEVSSFAEDSHWMREALREAERAGRRGEVPVGAVVVGGGRVLGRAGNAIEASQDPTAHAEVLALRQAAAALGTRRLLATTLYVTLEPCAMCAGAAVLARVPRLVFGATDPKSGACGSLCNIAADPRLNHRCQVRGGVLERECAELLKGFFMALRAAK
ncbi:MAG: tRNA adenosine(34) deaminase TadA [Gemmatimonadota bacterium]|nr:tRNA adenosine(34) deaminase TadA [Gemmatimonadota bacterium]